MIRQSRVRLTLSCAVLLAACTAADTAEPTPAPTPVPFGTVQTPTTAAAAAEPGTPTPRPRTCAFPLNLGDAGKVQEAAAYRFEWVQGEISQIVQTRGGPIALEGPVTLAAGERALIILHRGPVPERLSLSEDLGPDTALLYDPETTAYELRSADGTVLRQLLADPAEDVRGLPPNLDILSVDRQFGADGGFIIRVTVAAPDDGQSIWTFEGVEILLGDERFAERTQADGKVISGYYDPQGQFSEWGGTMIIQGDTVTWALSEGGELPFGAHSFTSAADGDATPMFPVDLMSRIWQAASAGCG